MQTKISRGKDDKKVQYEKARFLKAYRNLEASSTSLDIKDEIYAFARKVEDEI